MRVKTPVQINVLRKIHPLDDYHQIVDDIGISVFAHRHGIALQAYKWKLGIIYIHDGWGLA